MPKLHAPRTGSLVPTQPNGVPLFFEKRAERVVTANPWAFFNNCAEESLDRSEAARAKAYISQAFDFYHAAENPRIGSKPLLYYYSFLNLAKLALLVYGVSIPLRLMHGIEDPAANIKKRLRVTGQEVKMRKASASRNLVWPEFWRILGGDTSVDRTMRLLDVLEQVPTIHRTYNKVTHRRAKLLPVERLEAFHDRAGVWFRMVLRRRDRDVQLVLPSIRKREDFSGAFRQVASPKDVDGSKSEIWFESDLASGQRRAVDTALRSLSERLYSLPFTTILTSQGYRLYVSDVRPDQWLHPAAAIYAAMFYFGSVTRYKPDVFGKILEGGYSWIVEEFLATAPNQFIYILASSLAGLEVVKPHAVLP